MQVLTSLALVGVLAAGALFAPSVSSPLLPSSPRALTQGKIWIGDGQISTGTYADDSHEPFDDAVNGGDLDSGGQIEVLPGTYTFTQTVTVPHGGIRIYGTKSAVLKLGEGFPGPLFEVTGAEFVLEGVTLVADEPAAAQLVHVEAPGAAVLDCRISLASVGEDGFALDFEYPGGEEPKAVLVQGNSFEFATDASQWGGLRIREHRATRVIANRFSAADEVQQASVLTAIYVEAGEWTTLEGNSFVRLSAPFEELGADGEALVNCYRDPVLGGEGGHLVFNANSFRDVAGHSILRVESLGFTGIEGNAFGRLASPGGAVRLLDGTSDIVHANQFVEEPEATGSNPAVVIRGGRGTVVSGCVFRECTDTQIVCEPFPGPTNHARATFSGNWFEAASGAVGPVPAIELGAATPVAATGNSARGAGLWSMVFHSNNPPPLVIQLGNYVF
ncbi:MAG TPA: hypothetical protein VJP77_01950 [Planctomycetota bacterium]|nr:hypothetical protein [Planctomycetota bacterium]